MKKTLALLALCALPSCASIVEGSKQTIAIDSQPECASCSFEQDGKQVAEVRCTSGTIEVDRLKHDIKATCTKAGYGVSTQYLDSGFEEWTLGNILLGGVIGLGVDWATGALHKYPERAQVTLQPKLAAAPQAAPSSAPVVNHIYPAAPFEVGESSYVAIPQHSAPAPATTQQSAALQAPAEAIIQEPIIQESSASLTNGIWAQ